MAKNGSEGQSTWPGIVAAVGTPLALLALVILVLQSILVILAAVAPAADRRIFFYLLVGVFVLTFLPVVLFPGRFRPAAQKKLDAVKDIVPLETRFDFFLSAPMAALPDDAARQAYREKLLAIEQALVEHCGFRRSCYIGRSIVTSEQYQEPSVALRENLQDIRDSRFFVLVYLERMPTSSLVEAGIALALRKPAVYFVADTDDLPFLLKRAFQAASAGDPDLPQIRTYDARSPEDIVRLIENNGRALFPDIQ